MFNKKFKVVEIRSNGATITHYLNGKKKDVDNDIERYKKSSKNYEMIGKDGMIVWV